LALERVGRIWAGGRLDLSVEPGPHRLAVWSGKVRVGAETVTASEAFVTEYVLTLSDQPAWKSFLGFRSVPVAIRLRGDFLGQPSG
jgi:hypothetical protein